MRRRRLLVAPGAHLERERERCALPVSSGCSGFRAWGCGFRGVSVFGFRV